MSKVKKLPARSKVKQADQWDLSSLYDSDESWELDFAKWEKKIEKYASFQGKLAKSANHLSKCMKFDYQFERSAERLGAYAFLKASEDVANSSYQGMVARYQNGASRAAQAASYIRPEILEISNSKLQKFIKSAELAPYRTALERLVRYKPHTLSEPEERLMAMQSEMASTAQRVFAQLNDADLKFGTVENDKGQQIELSHSSFSACLHSAKRSVRKNSFKQYYEHYSAHENTLAASLNGSIQCDVFYAQARGHKSALESSLFADNVPVSVYENLIASIHRNLPALYRYFEVRRRAMKLKEIHHYDTYVPIISELQSRYSWKEAVRTVVESLEPLGGSYREVLNEGLRNGWCDRYENQGKRSGAFSYGTYDGDPYILMNYQPEVLDHVFTLAHEAGHSMHSYYSAKYQPFPYYNYTIFVAEVASTFNEQLLSRHLMEKATSSKERAFLINREIDSIRGTIIRQTMFAEFEKISHEIVESHQPLTVDAMKSEYRKLLELYFGKEFVIDEELSLECLRIPHFYRAFYVYKYATGLSAAIALSERVVTGGEQELQDYLGFLKGGCSQYPLDLLRTAGVDMEQPGPVDTALTRFAQLVDELDELL